jgi:hypothetical protein
MNRYLLALLLVGCYPDPPGGSFRAVDRWPDEVEATLLAAESRCHAGNLLARYATPDEIRDICPSSVHACFQGNSQWQVIHIGEAWRDQEAEIIVHETAHYAQYCSGQPVGHDDRFWDVVHAALERLGI